MQLDSKLLKRASIFGLVSTELAIYVCGGFVAGKYLDKWLGTQPILTAIMSILGMVFAFKRIANVYSKEMKNKD